MRVETRYDRRPGHAHVRRGEIGPPEARWHDHGNPGRAHASWRGRWNLVADVRFCPGCVGPMVELLRGTDERGRFEIWACVDRCYHAGAWQGYRADGDRYRLAGPGRRVPPGRFAERHAAVANLVVLRDADYDAAALRRLRAR